MLHFVQSLEFPDLSGRASSRSALLEKVRETTHAKLGRAKEHTPESQGTHTWPPQHWNHQKLLPDEIYKSMKKNPSVSPRGLTGVWWIIYSGSRRQGKACSNINTWHISESFTSALSACSCALKVCWPIFWGSLKRAALKRCDNLVHVESNLENWDLFLTNLFCSHHKGDSKSSWDFILALPWHKDVHSFWVLAPNKCMCQENIRVLMFLPL